MSRFLRGIWLALALAAASASASDIRVVTESWAPFNYEDPATGKPAGFSVELLKAALERLGRQSAIEFLPWERAYRTALAEPNVLIFTMARTAERDNQFKWVAPIYPRTIYLYKLRSRTDIQLKSIEDARRYRIGTKADNDAATRNLISLGFMPGQNLETLHGNDRQNLQELKLGRVDLIIASEWQLPHDASSAGFPLTDFERTVALPTPQEEQYYFAFSMLTPDAVVAEFRRAFEKLREDGTYERIRRQHIGGRDGITPPAR